ncbi:MAG: CD36 family protein [Gammaproteobacteria bacterium]|nr:CD36 family protein [Gammaproteobacteria bacterium]
MIKSACFLMKKAAASSVFLIVAGTLLVLISQFINLTTVVPAIFSYVGFILIVAGLLIMLITTVAILLPRISRQLEQCQH